jgi:FAD/FMN-containing dehydrogenase
MALTMTDEILEGFGKRCRAQCRVVRPGSSEEIAAVFRQVAEQGGTVALRGAGCSAGDASLNAGAVVLDISHMNRVLAWDPAAGEITVEPGVTIEQLWRHTFADGWVPPVVPATMSVTVAGAAAANVHSATTWREGTFGEHILAFDLLLPSGETRTCSAEEHTDLFHAAIGGLGLFGAFTSLTLALRRISSGFLRVSQTAHGSLDALFDAFDAHIATPSSATTHLVGWLDTTATGEALGRGLLTAMRELGASEDAHPDRSLDPNLQLTPGLPLSILPIALASTPARPPVLTLAPRLADRARWMLGNLPFATLSRRRRYITANFIFDFPTGIRRFVRRPGGVIHHQSFLPRETARATCRAILERSQAAGLIPSQAILTKHLPSPFLLNYLPDGYWSLALDYAAPSEGEEHPQATDVLLCDLNSLVVDADGAFFLAQDSTLTPDLFARTVPPVILAHCARIKARHDPGELLQTDLYRRVLRPALAAYASTPDASHAVADGLEDELGTTQLYTVRPIKRRSRGKPAH